MRVCGTEIAGTGTGRAFAIANVFSPLRSVNSVINVMEDSCTAKKRKYDKIFCQHCSRDVAKSTWYIHRERFFDSASGQWKKENDNGELELLEQRPDFNFDQPSSDENEDSATDFFLSGDQDETLINVSYLRY